GDDDDGLAGLHAIVVVMALGETGAVADDVFRKPVAGIEQAGDGHKTAGASDDLAGDHFGVPGPEGVQHAPVGDGLGDFRRGGGDDGRVDLAGAVKQIGGGGVVAVGGGHGGSKQVEV